MLSTLGVAGARCELVGGAAAMTGAHDMAGMPGMAGMAGMPDDGAGSKGGECGHDAGAPAHGGAACVLVAHCGAMPAVPSAGIALAIARVEARQALVDDTRPDERSLEPDSPPPRG
jgi:hypothetical protein